MLYMIWNVECVCRQEATVSSVYISEHSSILKTGEKNFSPPSKCVERSTNRQFHQEAAVSRRVEVSGWSIFASLRKLNVH